MFSAVRASKFQRLDSGARRGRGARSARSITASSTSAESVEAAEASELETSVEEAAEMAHPASTRPSMQQRLNVVTTIERQHGRPNTKEACEKNIFEYFEHANHRRATVEEALRYLVSFDNIAEFVLCQAFREKRPTTAKHKQMLRRDGCVCFDKNEHNRIAAAIDQSIQNNVSPPEPKKGCQVQHMWQVRSALKKLCKTQVANNTNSLSWDLVWKEQLEDTVKMVAARKNRQKRKNYDEKQDCVSSPCQAVEKLQDVEDWFFQKGVLASDRAAFAGLRNRHTCLRTLGAVLRGESLIGEELSDYFGVSFQTDRDPHRIEIAISQIANGETNKGVKIFGRAMRHKDVRMCACGALGFWLLHRFHKTGEMDSPPDWLKNEDWFDVKVLVDLQNFEESKTGGITEKSCAQEMTNCLRRLGLPTHHQLHFGRFMGPTEMELLDEATNENIRMLGNWDPKQQEKSHSSKLPMKAMKSKACCGEKGVVCTERVVTEPCDEMHGLFMQWVEHGLQRTGPTLSTNNPKKTAHGFLLFMQNMKRAVIQDAACMMPKHPERCSHAVFQLPLFSHPLFLQFKDKMKVDLEGLASPADGAMDIALPGLRQHIAENRTAIRNCHDTVGQCRSELATGVNAMRQDIAELQCAVTGTVTAVGRALVETGNAMTGGTLCPAAQVEAGSEAEGGDTGTPMQDASPPFHGCDHRPNWNDIKHPRAVVDQWLGQGTCDNIPVFGGIAKMELDHGTKWRHPWKQDRSLLKRLSRMKAIGMEHQRLIMENNIEKDEAIAMMETDWSMQRSFSKYGDMLNKKFTAAKRAAKASTDDATEADDDSADKSSQPDDPPVLRFAAV